MTILPQTVASRLYTPNLHSSNFPSRYIPNGNSKFAAISIENPSSTEQSILKFKLFVDGKEKWQHVLLSPSTTSQGFGVDGEKKTAGDRLKNVFGLGGN